jgi:cytochrome b involved in lipid metabolism
MLKIYKSKKQMLNYSKITKTMKHFIQKTLLALLFIPLLAHAQATTTYTAATVATHNTESSCWIIISGKVYDVTAYLSMHPGGRSVMTPLCGKDATTGFTTRGGTGTHSNSAFNMLGNFQIGTLVTVTNGSCGTSNNGTFSVAPTTGLCSSGTASTVSGTSSFSWSCAGVNGGTTATCQANFGTTTVVVPPVATTTPTGTSTKAINQKYNICVQQAITKRDTATLNARIAYNTAMSQALTARTQAETQAIALTDITAQQNALRAARTAYRTAAKNAQTALTQARQVALTAYEADLAKCKTDKKLALQNATTTSMIPVKPQEDNRGKGRGDDRKDDDHSSKSSESKYQSDFMKKFEKLTNKFKKEEAKEKEKREKEREKGRERD